MGAPTRGAAELDAWQHWGSDEGVRMSGSARRWADTVSHTHGTVGWPALRAGIVGGLAQLTTVHSALQAAGLAPSSGTRPAPARAPPAHNSKFHADVLNTHLEAECDREAQPRLEGIGGDSGAITVHDGHREYFVHKRHIAVPAGSVVQASEMGAASGPRTAAIPLPPFMHVKLPKTPSV